MMYKNFSSLSVFATGHWKHRKIRQINKLASEYGVDLITGCKTWMDWRFVTNEESRFPNLLGNGMASPCQSTMILLIASRNMLSLTPRYCYPDTDPCLKRILVS